MSYGVSNDLKKLPRQARMPLQSGIAFSPEQIAAGRITAYLAMRGGTHNELWHFWGPSPDESSAMVCGYAFACAGFGKQWIVYAPAIVKEARAVIALGIRALAKIAREQFPNVPLPAVDVYIRQCGFAERLSTSNALALALWREVLGLCGSRIRVVELVRPNPLLANLDSLVKLAQRAREHGTKEQFASTRPGRKTTFDAYDLPAALRPRWTKLKWVIR